MMMIVYIQMLFNWMTPFRALHDGGEGVFSDDHKKL